jgi:hypothetical protein
MTISDFATKHTISERTVRVWIEKGYIPGASLAEDYVPASARKPYTKARAKTSDAIYCSIVNASRNHFHVLPALYGLCEDEFNGYVNRLVEAGYIVRRTTDDVTYYDATPQAKHYKKLELLKVLEPAIKAASEGITTAAFEFAQKELL